MPVKEASDPSLEGKEPTAPSIPTPVQFCFPGALGPQKPYGLLRMGKRRWGKREITYLSPHWHHQNDSCVKTGSDESHFNVPRIVRDKVARQCPQTTTFSKWKDSQSRIEPRPFCLPAQHLTAGLNQPTLPLYLSSKYADVMHVSFVEPTSLKRGK